MPKQFAKIITFGCQMNISDSERISAVLSDLKYKATSNINEADLIVVNMCSVRQSAVDRVHGLRQKLAKLKQKKPNLKTILTGCILKKDKSIFINDFDFVADIEDISNITPKYSNKFSANLPIMTGCNNFCSYCVVPYTRKREVSRPAEEIIREIKNLVNPTSPRLQGTKEIWLLGQNVNSYKHARCASDRSHSEHVVNFSKLLKMANDIPGDFWIRFTSSHPKDFSDQLIKTMAKCKKATPYLNLPMQSGDNRILKAMNRHYTAGQYKNLVKKIRQAMPDISLSTDIIVGFPGETKKQFENTAKLFRQIKFDMAYINKYSPRAGTAAAKLKDNVSPAEKKRREKVLTEILKQTALEHNKKLIGRKITVLIDSQKGDFYFGKSEGYKTIKIQNPTLNTQCLIGQFVLAKIINANPWGIEATLINE